MAQQSGFDGGGICARSGKVMATIAAQSRSAPKEREIRRLIPPKYNFLDSTATRSGALQDPSQLLLSDRRLIGTILSSRGR
jgi:hypothetical protein